MVNIGATDGTVRYSLLGDGSPLRGRAPGRRERPRPYGVAHAHHYAQVAGRADAGLRGADEARWVVGGRPRARQLPGRAPVDGRGGRRRPGHAALPRACATTCSSGSATRSWPGERQSWLFPAAERHPLFVEVCGAVGEGLTARGEMEGALTLADRALSGLTGVDDVRRMYALRVDGMVALYVGRLDDGFRQHSEMLRLARLHDRPYEEAMALLGLAQSCTYAGHPDRGLAFADEQLRVALRLRQPVDARPRLVRPGRGPLQPRPRSGTRVLPTRRPPRRVRGQLVRRGHRAGRPGLARWGAPRTHRSPCPSSGRSSPAGDG